MRCPLVIVTMINIVDVLIFNGLHALYFSGVPNSDRKQQGNDWCISSDTIGKVTLALCLIISTAMMYEQRRQNSTIIDLGIKCE
jgi:hypothetical protein